MPRLKGVASRITQPIYDTMQVAAAAGPRTFAFFSVPLNGVLAGAVTKTLAHTNLRQAGKLPSGAEFDIEGISMYVREEIAAGTRPVFVDLQELHTGHLELKFNTKTYLELPLAQVPSGGAELSYFSNITPAATEFHTNRGVNAVANIFPLQNVITVYNNEDFRVDVTIPGTTTVIFDLTVCLWGQLTGVVN